MGMWSMSSRETTRWGGTGRSACDRLRGGCLVPDAPVLRHQHGGAGGGARGRRLPAVVPARRALPGRRNCLLPRQRTREDLPMTLLHPNVLLLLLGLPAGIVAILLLAVTLIMKRRDANWARAAELEAPPATEEESAALAQYSTKETSDEDFFASTVVEAEVKRLGGHTTVEALNLARFRRED